MNYFQPSGSWKTRSQGKEEELWGFISHHSPRLLSFPYQQLPARRTSAKGSIHLSCVWCCPVVSFRADFTSPTPPFLSLVPPPRWSSTQDVCSGFPQWLMSCGSHCSCSQPEYRDHCRVRIRKACERMVAVHLIWKQSEGHQSGHQCVRPGLSLLKTIAKMKSFDTHTRTRHRVRASPGEQKITLEPAGYLKSKHSSAGLWNGLNVWQRPADGKKSQSWGKKE